MGMDDLTQLHVLQTDMPALTLVCCVVNWADRGRVPYLAPLQPMIGFIRMPGIHTGEDRGHPCGLAGEAA